MADEQILPNKNDVLMGRGGSNNKHIGNARFRILAQRRIMQYSTCSKADKPKMHISLVMDVFSMTPPGRFIKKDKKSGHWLKVDVNQAVEKASRTLRDAVAKHHSSCPSLRHASLDPTPSHIASTSSVNAGAQRKRKASEMTSSTTSLRHPKRQRVWSPPSTCHLSPRNPRKPHSSTIRPHRNKQDATTNNDNAPSSFMCTAGSSLVRTRSKKDILGARDADEDGLRCKSSFSLTMRTMRTKPPKPDRVSESVADVEITNGRDGVVLGSTTKTAPQCWIAEAAAMVTPSTTTNTSSLLNPLSSQHSVSPALKMDSDEKEQHHHYVIQQEQQRHDCYSCGKENLSMTKPTSLDFLHQRVEKNAPSFITTIAEEEEWTSSTSSTFSSCASQNNNAFGEQPAEEEEQEGLDRITYSRLMAIFSND